MVLKQNKFIYSLIILLFSVPYAKAQYTEDSIYYPSESTPEMSSLEDTTNEYSEYESENRTNYNAFYHFSDTELLNHQYITPNKKLDRDFWLKESKQINFNEDSTDEKPKDGKNSNQKLDSKRKNINGSNFNLNSLKNIWIILALIILVVLIVLMIPVMKHRNMKFKENVVINFDDLDEQTLREAELDTPLANALRQKDYRTAYRLRYLSVLQQLIAKNLIFYKKEKTNYEYLLQLTGKKVYEPFRMLTFNFDGIWYGELLINEQVYNQLNDYFITFESQINN